jgi:plastocyanin
MPEKYQCVIKANSIALLSGSILVVSVMLLPSMISKSSFGQSEKDDTSSNDYNSGSLIKVTIDSEAPREASNAFRPNPIYAKVGDTIEWINRDTIIHTVTSGDGPDDIDKGIVFDSQILPPTRTFSYMVDRPGQLMYFCELHPQMVGTINASETTITPEFSLGLPSIILTIAVITTIVLQLCTREEMASELPKIEPLWTL